MTPEQLQTLKADILANQDTAAVAAVGNLGGVAALYNSPAVPTFYGKRTELSRHEILTGTSDEATTFTWTGGAYITRSQGERDAFREMFNSTGTVNPSLASISAAFNDIFSGAGGAGNRAHIAAISRRKLTRVEKLFAVGIGTQATPATVVFEGDLSNNNISDALESV